MRDVDAFLAEADDAIDDWESSPDAASWNADGSHEYDSDGDYYLCRPSPIVDLLSHAIRQGTRLASVEARGARPSLVIHDEAQLYIAPVNTPLQAAGAFDAMWQRLNGLVAPAVGAVSDADQPSYHAIGRAVEPRVTDSDAPTDDARQPLARRRGVDAQTSPFGPQRRGH